MVRLFDRHDKEVPVSFDGNTVLKLPNAVPNYYDNFFQLDLNCPASKLRGAYFKLAPNLNLTNATDMIHVHIADAESGAGKRFNPLDWDMCCMLKGGCRKGLVFLIDTCIPKCCIRLYFTPHGEKMAKKAATWLFLMRHTLDYDELLKEFGLPDGDGDDGTRDRSLAKLSKAELEARCSKAKAVIREMLERRK